MIRDLKSFNLKIFQLNFKYFLKMRKSNNAFYQSDPDFSNDSEPRTKEDEAY